MLNPNKQIKTTMREQFLSVRLVKIPKLTIPTGGWGQHEFSHIVLGSKKWYSPNFPSLYLGVVSTVCFTPAF